MSRVEGDKNFLLSLGGGCRPSATRLSLCCFVGCFRNGGSSTGAENAPAGDEKLLKYVMILKAVLGLSRIILQMKQRSFGSTDEENAFYKVCRLFLLGLNGLRIWVNGKSTVSTSRYQRGFGIVIVAMSVKTDDRGSYVRREKRKTRLAWS
ncbi:hypothetical protein B0H19DRAFT_1055583 [Mycena capillaripes]|nr:hypothetical protein B0H19DRAFT_1055583 [Mycena capillaripes]